MKTKTLIIVLIAIALVACVGLYLPVNKDGQTIIEKTVGANPGPDFYNLVQLMGGVVKGNYIATSTPASMTLKVGDIAGYDVITINPTGAAASKTLTFFASSSASSWLSQAGMVQDTCFINATGTAATTIVFAAGTGIDLKVASSTSQVGGAFDLTLAAGQMGCFKFVRKAATASTFDIIAGLTEYNDAD